MKVIMGIVVAICLNSLLVTATLLFSYTLGTVLPVTKYNNVHQVNGVTTLATSVNGLPAIVTDYSTIKHNDC
jgi:hypothetical protein